MSYILNYLEEEFQKHPDRSFTAQELSVKFEKEKSTVSRNLKRLKDLGKIRYTRTERLGKKNFRFFQFNPEYTTTTAKPNTTTTAKPNTTTTAKPNTTTTTKIIEGKRGMGKTNSQIQHLKTELEGRDLTIKDLQFSLDTIKQEKEGFLQLIDNQKKTIEELDLLSIDKRPVLIDFLSFSDLLLTDAIVTGSNSLSLGELHFRRSDLKNWYLLITKFQNNIFVKE